MTLLHDHDFHTNVSKFQAETTPSLNWSFCSLILGNEEQSEKLNSS